MEEKPESKEEVKIEPSNNKDKEPEKPVTDFKIAEIWVRSGKVMLEAPPNFWADKCRALGVLDFCKDIVKTAKIPEQPQNKIIPAKGSMISGMRNFYNKFRRN